MPPPDAEPNSFLTQTAEQSDLNQYWFSRDTINTFVAEIADSGGNAALVSSPSVYFSLPDSIRNTCKVLDYDRQWESDPGYVFYDFNEPEALPPECHNAFDFVLVDPPFITLEVWEKYAATVKLLVRESGRILCTTIAESVDMMHELLALHPVLFRPSIPSLVYQYSIYTNYESSRLGHLNPEIDDEDWRLAGAPSKAEEGPEGACRGALQASSAPITSCRGIAASNDEDEGPIKEADTSPLPPEAQILVDLRERVNAVKRAVEALHAPLQLSLRRRGAGGSAAAAAAERASAALDSAAEAARGLQAWSSEHAGELATALGEAASDSGPDRWRTQAVSDLVTRARELDSMEAYKSFALVSRQHAAALFRLSSLLLDRVKALKRAPPAAAPPGS